MQVTLNFNSDGVDGIDFIFNGSLIGEIKLDINPPGAYIRSVYLLEGYKRNGLLKSKFPEVLSYLKSRNVSNLTLVSPHRDIWIKLGFIETDTNFFTLTF